MIKHYCKLWFFYLFLSYTLYYVFALLLADNSALIDSFNWIWLLIDLVYGAVLSSGVVLVTYFTHRFFPVNVHKSVFYIHSIDILVICVLLAYLTELFLDKVFWPDSDETSGSLYLYSIVGACLAIVVLMREYYTMLNQHQENERKLKLALLKNQLGPHFMFNNLSTLDALIDDAPQVAHAFLHSFSGVYRHITRYVTNDLVPVDEAIHFLSEYTSMLEIRHPGHFNIIIDERLTRSKAMLPTMSIQLATENAIKHNRHSRANPLSITYLLDGDRITIRNGISPVRTVDKKDGYGIRNLNLRSRILTGRDILTKKDETHFEISIPIIQSQPL